jgi:hypothetical protein
MKKVKIFANANHEALEVLANEAVNDPNFMEIHYGVHAVLVVYRVPDEDLEPLQSAALQKNS